MVAHSTLLGPLLAFAAGAASQIATTDETPLLGPNFLANFDPTNASAVEAAKEAFPGVIEELFSQEVLNQTDLIFAVDVYSAATNESIYSYYHVGEGQEAALTAGELGDRTLGRLGSVTKMFTVYALLAQAGIGIFSQPVTDYLPELRALNQSADILTHIAWEEITVGSLASHQAGSGGGGDLLPVEPDAPLPTTHDLLMSLRDTKHPVIAPFRSSVYSDNGFALLTVILERITCRPYREAIIQVLAEPLGLDDLTATQPNGTDVNAIDRSLIAEGSAWNVEVPIFAGSGGLYGHAADLRKVGLSILNSELLSPATISQWMRPLSGTGSLAELVGAPWEISRLMIPVSPGSNRTRISDLYTKAGGNGDYTAIFALSPDHGIGFSILVAGSTATPARWPIRDAVGTTFIPAFEAAAFENAVQNVAGTFVGEQPGTNLTLTVDDDKPGVGLESYYLDGVESSGLLGRGTVDTEYVIRMYPTGVNSFSRSLASRYKTNGTFWVANRLIPELVPLAPRPAADGGVGGLFENAHAWMSIDSFGPIDEVVFELVEGRVETVKMSTNGTIFTRAE
ncbi:hypothetical protein S40285_02513 [Stachybotrys chlorohalonatus IBT 40285]|uniref:Uncharacterized protein n=1 Tax=Stachybotrys chlorohalonatus (strain IBT 40285) TaxID=1283841 RepID=A0A084QWL7_STAC4|nr:hypothetical protein S40285_02513 [Stachybotrys chlorohalonata IBT 40285]